MQLTDNARGAILMTVAMAGFTLNDTAMKVVMEDLPLFQAIGLRGVLASLTLLVIGWRMGGLRLNLPRRDWWLLAVRSVAEVVGTLTFLAALDNMPLATLSAILQALPLAVTLAAAMFLGNPVGWRRMTAIVVGFIGVLIIIRPGAEGVNLWALMGLASVICVVVRDLTTRRMSGSLPSVTVALTAAVTVLAMGGVGTLIQGWQPVSFQSWALLFAAATALIVGYLTVVMTMRVGEISFVAPFRYTALLWAMAMDFLIYGHLFDRLTMFGAALVVATGIFTFWRERQLAQTRQSDA